MSKYDIISRSVCLKINSRYIMIVLSHLFTDLFSPGLSTVPNLVMMMRRRRGRRRIRRRRRRKRRRRRGRKKVTTTGATNINQNNLATAVAVSCGPPV